MSALSLAHGITAFISARNRSRRVVLPLAAQDIEANVVCFILFSPFFALMRFFIRHDSRGLVQSFPRRPQRPDLRALGVSPSTSKFRPPERSSGPEISVPPGSELPQ